MTFIIKNLDGSQQEVTPSGYPGRMRPLIEETEALIEEIKTTLGPSSKPSFSEATTPPSSQPTPPIIDEEGAGLPDNTPFAIFTNG